MLSNIATTMQQKVINLYDTYDTDFNLDRYNRIIDMVTQAIVDNSDISMMDKLKLYYASLLHPTDHINFHGFDYENAREILNELPNFIHNKNCFIEEIIQLIKINISNPSNPDEDLWKYILSDCINIDLINPKRLYDYAIFLRKNGVPLYTRYVPYIKNKNNLDRICHPTKKYNCFMEYIYHIGLFLTDQIKSNNKYLLSLIESNREKMIRLCLIYGDKEYITLDDLREWADIKLE